MDHLLADLLLGLIEGITEFLPISSTGHLLIAERWLGARSDLFNIAIQAGAILAVVLIYRERLWQLLRGLGEAANRDYAAKLAAAFGVTAVLGILVKKLGFELPETVEPIAWALIIGGFVMLGAEAIAARRAGRGDVITWPVALLVGVAQVVAGVFPGTSRSAAAIFAALLFGTGNRLVATEFAFLIGIPTMFAATGYELLHVLRTDGVGGEDWSGLAVAFITSAITAFVAVNWLLGYIQTHRFTVFAWYRIALGIVLLALPAVQAGSSAAQESSRTTESKEAAYLEAQFWQEPTTPGLRGEAAAVETAPGRSRLAMSETRARADKQYLALKLCVDGSRINEMLKDPVFRKDLEDAATKPSQADRQWQVDVMERMAKSLEIGERSTRECQGQEARVADGSIYDLALAAARLGNQDAALCYVAGGYPMDEKRWKDPAFHATYVAEVPGLINRGIAAGDWRMVRHAQMVYSSAPRLTPHNGPRDPWRSPNFLLSSEVVPGGDPLKYYALLRLSSLGENTRNGGDFAKLAAFQARGLSPRQVAVGDAWAQRIFATAFGSRPRPPTSFEYLCE